MNNSVLGIREANADAEAGARLTCHLLLRLFKTNENPQPSLYSVGKTVFPKFIWFVGDDTKP